MKEYGCISKRQAEALIVLQSLVYGFGDPISKIAFEVTPVYTMMTVRYLIAFAVSFTVFHKRITRTVRTVPVKAWLIPGICISLHYILNNVALALTDATSVAFLRSLSIVITPAFAFLVYRTSYKWQHIVLQILVLPGMYLLCVRGGLSGAGTGEAMALVAAFMSAGALVFSKRYLDMVDPVSMTALMAGCSITYDAMVLISTLCFTASILRARHEPENRAALIESAVWAAVIGSVKGGGYLILLPLVIVLLTGDFSKSVKKAAPILAAGLLSALIFDVLLSAGGLFQLGGTAAGKLSFSYAITHPLNYLDLMLRSYATFANSLSFGIGGSRMGWAEKDVIPDIMIAGLLVSAGVMSVFEKDRFSFTKRDRNVFLGIIALIVFTMPAMLLSWTSAGSDMIMGLQGRYFLPVLPLIFFVFTKFTVRVRTDSSRERITGIGRKYMIWFAVLSCLCVYFMMRLYLTR